MMSLCSSIDFDKRTTVVWEAAGRRHQWGAGEGYIETLCSAQFCFAPKAEVLKHKDYLKGKKIKQS